MCRMGKRGWDRVEIEGGDRESECEYMEEYPNEWNG